MILKNTDVYSFCNKLDNHKLVCFGVGKEIDKMIINYSSYSWENRIIGLLDNDINKQGKTFKIQTKEYVIQGINDFINKIDCKTIILITCSYYYDIVKQLNKIPKLNNVECYIYNFMISLMPKYTLTFNKSKTYHIPPKIHYCWFGKQKLPNLYEKCIDSWKRYCPDYELVRWDENNCDIKENLYAYQAYKNKKYGFVPDYFRLKIVHEHGGIYLDTDVELIKNIDNLRYYEGFCGLQLPGEVALGLGFGAKKDNRVIKKLLDRYSQLFFEDKEGNLNETISPIYQTEDLIEIGMELGNKLQTIDDMTILPTDVLSPKNLLTSALNITENTFAIHHYDGSWLSGERLIQKIKRIERAKEIQELFE